MEPVECPDEVQYLVGYFNSMNTRRSSSGFGPNPISHADVEAWARGAGRAPLSPFEVDALWVIEKAYLASIPKAEPK